MYSFVIIRISYQGAKLNQNSIVYFCFCLFLFFVSSLRDDKGKDNGNLDLGYEINIRKRRVG
jgi:hypothetical protein